MRWLDPQSEKERMHMRKMRHMVEANADDLVRTMTMHSEDIKALMRSKNGNWHDK